MLGGTALAHATLTYTVVPLTVIIAISEYHVYYPLSSEGGYIMVAYFRLNEKCYVNSYIPTCH